MSDESNTDQPGGQEPVDAAPPPPEQPIQPIQPGQPGQPPAAYQPPPTGYGPPPYHFAAVPRPPREPWINPAKRTSAVIISLVAALVLLFVGAVIGHVATRHHDERFSDRGDVQRKQGPVNRIPGYQLPRNGEQRPQRPGPGTVTVTPSATTS